MCDLKSLIRAGLFAAALLGGAADAFATWYYFKVRLTGAEAGVVTAADGAAFLRYDDQTQVLDWTVNYRSLSSSALSAHIDGPGTAFDLTLPIAASPLVGSVTLEGIQSTILFVGGWSMDIRTANHPDGEIRGRNSQVTSTGPAYRVPMDGLQAGTPGNPVTTPATGSGSVTFHPGTMTMSWNLNISSLGSAITAAHFHGPANRFESAAIKVATGTASPITGSTVLSAVDAADMVNGLWYFKVHTAGFPDGEIRGQVRPMRSLVVNVDGSGGGQVTSDLTAALAAGITCPPNCSDYFDDGSQVTLTATPAAGSTFIGWTGPTPSCQTNPCVLTMSSVQSVVATFVMTVPPVITSAGSATFVVGSAGSFQVSATGMPLGLVSVTGTFPAGVSAGNFSVSGPGTFGRAIQGTPAPGTAGIYPLTITASNGFAPDAVQSFTLTVMKRAQTISFPFTYLGKLLVGATFDLIASASSGLAVTFTSATPSVCTVTGSHLTTLAPGTCTIKADQAGDGEYEPAPQVERTVMVHEGDSGPGHLVNISTRMQVLTGNDVMIAGFIIGGNVPKTVVINVAGPNLFQYGISALVNPKITLVRSSDQSVLKSNDDWQAQDTPADVAAITATGFQPNNSEEPAIIATLAPGAYTVIVEGVGGARGVGLVGVFEVDHPESPLINISTRGQVLTDNDVMIAGFIIQGSTPQRLVVSVAGPSLTNFGIAGALANPTLTLVQCCDASLVIATNDDWQVQAGPADVAAIEASGFQPNHPLEPAIIATLPPGSYTAIVQGVNRGTGVGLVGVFAVP